MKRNLTPHYLASLAVIAMTAACGDSNPKGTGETAVDASQDVQAATVKIKTDERKAITDAERKLASQTRIIVRAPIVDGVERQDLAEARYVQGEVDISAASIDDIWSAAIVAAPITGSSNSSTTTTDEVNQTQSTDQAQSNVVSGAGATVINNQSSNATAAGASGQGTVAQATNTGSQPSSVNVYIGGAQPVPVGPQPVQPIAHPMPAYPPRPLPAHYSVEPHWTSYVLMGLGIFNTVMNVLNGNCCAPAIATPCCGPMGVQPFPIDPTLGYGGYAPIAPPMPYYPIQTPSFGYTVYDAGFYTGGFGPGLNGYPYGPGLPSTLANPGMTNGGGVFVPPTYAPQSPYGVQNYPSNYGYSGTPMGYGGAAANPYGGYYGP